MYHAHNMLWLLPVALACALGAAVTGRLCKRRGSKVPGRLPEVFIFGFMASIALMIVMREYDDARERAELRGIDPAGVSHLTLSHAGVKKEINEPDSVLAVMSELKKIKYVGAHHSHDNDFVDIGFEFQQRPYHYQIGRDSERAQEYWIGGAGGRIQSAKFGPLIDKLVPQPTPPTLFNNH
jgi:hypothetical protein